MINKATILGRIGKKDFKPTKNGSFVCLLSIATNRNYIDSSGQKREITTWHNVNLFNKLAEVANKYANVGDLIYVEGEIVNKKIEENGQSRVIHSITGSEIKLIPTNKKSNDSTNDQVKKPDNDFNDNDEDLPF